MTNAPPGTADTGSILLLSQGFAAWMASQTCSLALTTYQAGRLFLIGAQAGWQPARA